MGRQRNDTPSRLTIDDNNDDTTGEGEEEKQPSSPSWTPQRTLSFVDVVPESNYPSQRQGYAPYINHGRGSTVKVGPANIGGDARGEEAATRQA